MSCKGRGDRYYINRLIVPEDCVCKCVRTCVRVSARAFALGSDYLQKMEPDGHEVRLGRKE